VLLEFGFPCFDTVIHNIVNTHLSAVRFQVQMLLFICTWSHLFFSVVKLLMYTSLLCLCSVCYSACHVRHWHMHVFASRLQDNKTSCRWAAATICPRPSAPPWAPKRLALPSRRQRSSSFPLPTRSHAHRCSCLTRQHGELSGLLTLTFDLLILKVVSKSRVTWATSVPL